MSSSSPGRSAPQGVRISGGLLPAFAIESVPVEAGDAWATAARLSNHDQRAVVALPAGDRAQVGVIRRAAAMDGRSLPPLPALVIRGPELCPDGTWTVQAAAVLAHERLVRSRTYDTYVYDGEGRVTEIYWTLTLPRPARRCHAHGVARRAPRR